MRRRVGIVLAVAVVAVLALSLSAATLTSAAEPSGEGSGELFSGGEGPFGFSPIDEDRPEVLTVPELPTVVERMLLGLLALSVLLSVVQIVFSPEKLVELLAVFGMALLFVGMMLVGLSVIGDMVELTDGDLLPPGEPGQDEGEGTGSGAFDVTRPPLFVAAGIVVLVLLGTTLVLGRRDGAEGDAGETGRERGGGTPRTGIGPIAGTTADRIEGETGDEAVANEVYRAWQEMTAHLEMDRPDTTTPREFQHAATTAGMEATDVRELRQLFEAVRYGGQSATEDREERAISVLRRIESTDSDER